MTPSQFTALQYWLEYIRYCAQTAREQAEIERYKPKKEPKPKTTKDLLDDIPPF